MTSLGVSGALPVCPADVLFTGTQQRLLSLIFGQPERTFMVTELIALARSGRGAVQRELSRLEQAGLLLTERHGNQKHCRANPESPIFEELCGIVRKTVQQKKENMNKNESMRSS